MDAASLAPEVVRQLDPTALAGEVARLMRQGRQHQPDPELVACLTNLPTWRSRGSYLVLGRVGMALRLR